MKQKCSLLFFSDVCATTVLIVAAGSSEDEEEQLMEEAGFQEYQDDVDSLEGRPAPEPAVPQKDDPLPEAEQVNDPLAFLRQLCGSQPQSNMTTDMFHLPSVSLLKVSVCGSLSASV